MNKISIKDNQVSLCHKGLCINTYGKNAEMVANATAVMLLFIGIAALINAATK